MSQKMSDTFDTKSRTCNRKFIETCCLSCKLYVMTSWVVGQLRPLRLHPVGIELETVNSKRDFESIYFKLKLSWFKRIHHSKAPTSANSCQFQCPGFISFPWCLIKTAAHSGAVQKTMSEAGAGRFQSDVENQLVPRHIIQFLAIFL